MKKYLYLLLTVLFFHSCQNDEEKMKVDDQGDVKQNESVNVDLTGKVILGSPTDNSINVSVLAVNGTDVSLEYGVSREMLSSKSSVQRVVQDGITEITLVSLQPCTRYYYRVVCQLLGKDPVVSDVYSFVTQRIAGSVFSFGIQGDSHPERASTMFNGDLYLANMKNAALLQPDFYFTLGDDFSIERLIESNTVSQSAVDEVYLNHRKYLGAIGCNASVFLVNGNHEQAAKYLLDGTAVSPAVCAAIARKKFYSLPDPEGIYSGNDEMVEHVGLLKDYYAFEWGSALFVVIDPYWHSDVAVDNIAGSMDKNSDPWAVTLGDRQYNWLKQTLETSKAKYKFVFSHHVRGTGRGGIEGANLYEWGGYDTKGKWLFNTKRPGWEMPIHQLMVKNGVTIFFQGHDHLFCKQELDGIVYQSVQNPADYTYTAFNADAYKTGVTMPNSGFLNVTVSGDQVKVDYIRAFLPGDGTNGEVAYSYVIK